jgi:Acyl-CoA reductase (LuxC)
MNLNKRIQAFTQLGLVLQAAGTGKEWNNEFLVSQKKYDQFLALIETVHVYNGWFNKENVLRSVNGIAFMLKENKIMQWIEQYNISNAETSKNIAVIAAGNIPLVSFHDFIAVLISGNNFIGKLSKDDSFLLPMLFEILVEIEPAFTDRASFVTGKLPSIDKVIATGSNNTARYFEFYFGKYPHIIRKNRNSVAIIEGTESKNELKELGNDIFSYFGLGCRNISKMYVPSDFDLDRFFNAIYDFHPIKMHNKYANNYDYNKAVWLLNNEQLLDNEFILLKEDKSISSPVASLYYQRYDSIKDMEEILIDNAANIQCIVSKNHVPFGAAQQPNLWDYADNVDTMKFLLEAV